MAVVKAIAHRDYRSTANVQIYIFHDRLEIVTPGGLPAGMREEDLGVKSVPRNPLLFGMFYRMGMVERVGSGIKCIRQMCRDFGVDEPAFEVSESWVTTRFKRPIEQLRHQVGTKSGPSRDQVEILHNSFAAEGIQTLMNAVGRTNRTKFRNQVLRPMLDAQWLEMTIPDKPTSSKQKYRITVKGKTLLNELKTGEATGEEK